MPNTAYIYRKNYVMCKYYGNIYLNEITPVEPFLRFNITVHNIYQAFMITFRTT